MIGSYQVTKLSARSGASPVRLLHEAISVFREVSINAMLPRLLPHSLDVPNLSPEKCVQLQALLCPPDYL